MFLFTPALAWAGWPCTPTSRYRRSAICRTALCVTVCRTLLFCMAQAALQQLTTPPARPSTRLVQIKTIVSQARSAGMPKPESFKLLGQAGKTPHGQARPQTRLAAALHLPAGLQCKGVHMRGHGCCRTFSACTRGAAPSECASSKRCTTDLARLGHPPSENCREHRHAEHLALGLTGHGSRAPLLSGAGEAAGRGQLQAAAAGYYHGASLDELVCDAAMEPQAGSSWDWKE